MWKHIYYFVPPCPKCGSRKTGRYIRSPLTGEGYTKEASLKNGELVRFSFEVPVNNGYCMSCGYEWPVRVETKLWSYTKIREEQIARGTDILYEKILSKKTKSKWDVGRYFHERYRNIEEVENQKEKDCVYSYYFVSLIYGCKHWILIFLMLVLTSFVTSVVIEKTKKLIHYSKLFSV